MLLRTGQAGKYLGVHAQTIRNWAERGELPHTRSGANQRLFSTEDLDAYKAKRCGVPQPSTQVKVFYVRSGAKDDITNATQQDKLRAAYGEPDKVFSDSASGLNENRRGLRDMLDYANTPTSGTVYVTNKDRLTRFGFSYLVELLADRGFSVTVLDSDDTKEPNEVLMQDFMSLLASYSGKFYRLRGWEQRRKFLSDVSQEVERRA